jgi:ESCRT-II complex subunit VPS22
MARVADYLHQQAVVQHQATELDKKKLKAAKMQLEQFQTILRRFAKKHKGKIYKDPEFRDSFIRMCDELDVDPLQSRGGFFAKALGVGDFYHELSVKIIDACDPLKRKHGPLIPLGEVIRAVALTYGSNPPRIQPSDIARALKNLKDIGYGYEIVVHGGIGFVKTVAFGLEQDSRELLEKAKDTRYFQFSRNVGMNEARFRHAATALMNEGLVWIDRGNGSEYPFYWVVAYFPALQ